MTAALGPLKDVIYKHWGYRAFRPLQEEAMRAVLDGRDSLVVLPTGGGKSLCYQAPAVLRGETTVVVSPLIALMKDQVDGLQACGVPAIQLDSSQSSEERYAYEMDVRQGAIRLLFVSPERLVMPNFQAMLRGINVRTFAVDEAHCISHWGHDFRPEYRQLAELRKHFPGASLHAYTATATERVRKDISDQLQLRDPTVLVGNFDRPNLTYRVLPRTDLLKQVREVLDRHRNEAGIIYCIRRKDVDELTPALQSLGLQARAYHAGMTADERRAAQEAFRSEECNLIVATVAFGMGIDRSNIRYVLHTGMPKSIEHYQQETGRAGRDGLEAECVLLHSGQDFMTWKFIIEKSAEEEKADPAHVPGMLRHLGDMQRYCTSSLCRHKGLVEYFGQKYSSECQACDICLGDAEEVPDAVVVAQKILSCVARVKEGFGLNHVASVLHGATTEGIRKWGHDQLTTYGLLKGTTRPIIQDWIRQLIGQGLLDQAGDEYPVLKLNAASWAVMKGERGVKLLQPARRAREEKPAQSKAAVTSWEGVDEELFEALRTLRRGLAEKRGVPPYQVFSDQSLREMAKTRPTTLEKFHLIYGVGEQKLRDFGPQFLKVINEESRARKLSQDNKAAPVPVAKTRSETPRALVDRNRAYALFREQASIADVARETEWGRAKVIGLLAEYIQDEKLPAIDTWVSEDVYERVVAAARRVGTERLKPIFVMLNEQIPYDDIRLVVAHLTTPE